MYERRRVKIVLILSFLPVFFTKNWLGGKDSNLRYRIQSPGPYRLATAHPRTSKRSSSAREKDCAIRLLQPFEKTLANPCVGLFLPASHHHQRLSGTLR